MWLNYNFQFLSLILESFISGQHFHFNQEEILYDWNENSTILVFSSHLRDFLRIERYNPMENCRKKRDRVEEVA